MSKTLAEWSAGHDGLPPIVTVAAWKGGDGKSTIARELAYALDAVLVDFDWDDGCSSRSMGYRHERYVRHPLREAFAKGRTPTPLRGRRKADLVPSYPAWGDEQPDRDEITDALERWARELGRPLVADTHPGGCEATYGAINAARVVVVPSVLVKESLNALEGMVNELTDYPLLVTPNKVSAPGAWARRRLAGIVRPHEIPMGPLIQREPWLEKRTLNIAVVSEPVAKQARRFVDSIDDLATAVMNYA
ncbi:hypothetical protein [Streptomyces sp. NPDC059708]|uniref:hypothetical protein n=1 Tax=Streptomyces sp. NPDC059708 TaxID=3346916 RepID=UPI00369A1842